MTTPARRLSIIVKTLVAISIAFVPVQSSAQPETDGWTAPPTPWGAPNLQGVWDFRTITPMEKPDGFEAVLTDKEVAEFETTAAETRAALDVEMPFDTVGNFWFDVGTSVIDTKRTSLVVDPPNGRIPTLTPEADARRAAGTESGRACVDTRQHLAVSSRI